VKGLISACVLSGCFGVALAGHELSLESAYGVRAPQDSPGQQMRPERLGVAPQEELRVFGGENNKTFLGCLSCPETDLDSLFNRFGPYGSRFAANSILNRFGPFGGKFAPFSPCNVYSTTPPVIVDDDGEDYGELTLNRDSPRQAKIEGLNAWLAALCAAK
jgi:hypothetical protein